MPSFYEEPRSLARAALEFWVEWHDYLKKMKLPTYKVENVTAGSIFRMSPWKAYFAKRLMEDASKQKIRSNSAYVGVPGSIG